jgi:hypothetical protein
MLEQLEIRTLIENWVLWRDSGDWDRFATLWHPQGRMVTTWSQAVPAAEFIARSRRAWESGELKVDGSIYSIFPEGRFRGLPVSRHIA